MTAGNPELRHRRRSQTAATVLDSVYLLIASGFTLGSEWVLQHFRRVTNVSDSTADCSRDRYGTSCFPWTAEPHAQFACCDGFASGATQRRGILEDRNGLLRNRRIFPLGQFRFE